MITVKKYKKIIVFHGYASNYRLLNIEKWEKVWLEHCLFINNLLLLKAKHVPINIKFVDRKQYYQAFNDFDTSGKTNLMEQIIATALSNSYHKRLAYLEGKEIITLKEYSIRTKQTHSNVINKAKRQTIDAFLEKGVWKIGV